MGMIHTPDCVIFAAGNPLIEEQVRPYLAANPFIITADGGYPFACAVGCTPNLILGDFDSTACPQTEIETLRLQPEKDDTDSAVAVKEAIARGYKKLVLFGGTGSRLDHTFANFYLSAYAKDNGADLTVVDVHHRIFALDNETQLLHKEPDLYVSVFPIGGACTVSLEGFYYPLNHDVLPPCSGLGVSNEITAPTAKITLHAGKALIFLTDKD